MKYSFTNWLEYADFGLDPSKGKAAPEIRDTEEPLNPLNVEYVINSLKSTKLGTKSPLQNAFFGEVQWGEQDGALRLIFSPLGGLRVVVRKLIHDLEGEPAWICKKVVEIKNYFDQHPDRLAYELHEELIGMDYEGGLEAPSRDYKDLERLAIRIGSELRSNTTQRIFMYQGIRVVQENYKYIVHFGVTGMGVQRAGQKRLDQFAVFVEYNKTSGLIKITGNELGDVIDKHRWIYDPSNFIEHFSPYQKEDEIKNAILAHFNSY